MSERKTLVEAIADAFRLNGDKGEALLAVLYRMSARYAAWLGSPEDIQDVISMTCEKITEMARDSLPAIDIANQTPMIMRNAAIDTWRKRSGIQVGLPDESLLPQTSDPAEEVISHEELDAVSAVLESLKPHERVAVERIASGSSYAQLQIYLEAEFGIQLTVGNLAVIVKRTRKKIADRVGRGRHETE